MNDEKNYFDFEKKYYFQFIDLLIKEKVSEYLLPYIRKKVRFLIIISWINQY